MYKLKKYELKVAHLQRLSRVISSNIHIGGGIGEIKKRFKHTLSKKVKKISDSIQMKKSLVEPQLDVIIKPLVYKPILRSSDDEKENVRMYLALIWHKDIPSIDTIMNSIKGYTMNEILLSINKYPYVIRSELSGSDVGAAGAGSSASAADGIDSDEPHGIFYPEEICELLHTSPEFDCSKLLWGRSNHNIWDIGYEDVNGSLYPIVYAKQYVLPSDAILSFLHGPTIADCTQTRNLTIYFYLLKILGKELFDYLFTSCLLNLKIYTNFTACNFLFDVVDTADEKEIENDDLVYMLGVPDYMFKHCDTGSFQGESLIAQKNDEGVIKYARVGHSNPNLYTCDEIRRELINEYNKPMNNYARKSYRLYQKKLLDITDPIERMHLNTKLKMCDDLQKDIKPAEYEIGGIKQVFRLNSEKLLSFIQFRMSAWHKYPLLKTHVTPDIEYPSFFMNTMTFETYETPTETNLYLKTIAQNFVSFVLNSMESFGLVLIGNPGVGKTHLCVACGKIFHAMGKRVMFITESEINAAYHISPDLSTISIDTYDVIIVDDINTEYGVANSFIKKIIPIILTSDKSILISSNTPTVMLSDHISTEMSYNHPLVNNFFMIRDIKLSSRRICWTTDDILGGMSVAEKINYLCDYVGNYAGLIIENAEILKSMSNAQIVGVAGQYTSVVHTKNAKLKTKIMGMYLDNQRVTPDFYARNIGEFDVIIITVHCSQHLNCEQFLNLVSNAYEHNKKIIVITNNLSQFNDAIMKIVMTKEDYVKRLTDRLKTYFVEFN